MEKGARHRNNTEKNHPGGSESEASPETGSGGGGVALKKEIGLVSACGIIVGNIIGSGIFVSPKGVLENASSVGLALIVWIMTGLITAVGALCYAELGVTIPKSGGDYSYVKDIFGGLAGFLRLWIAVLVIYPTNQAVIALTFSNYVLQPLFPTCFPPESGLRLLAAICLCKCHLGLVLRMASSSLPCGLHISGSPSSPSFFPPLLFFLPCYFSVPICMLWTNGFHI
ncbi:large neutral amino acids transporter small subunit 2-like [Physeter macrocephalus]|uniref:Large neutral amino acids transporter small subunit 2-like n=1 Tax=Physeter macrocephalus TaxID=9755 RepID=A0A455BRR2_PHYMC|nr:large neutral amino acids transporter small subunit 2-like [Physeter catodon]XP_028351669.1 large neutral amino acids transporter small subunit 2-like [Physeter catodon]XP_028351670.1 large neutral amino acids transporter small subunit 2-like [Physeter catodon]|eukprot:XP_028351668.1 large neutral amino acids transporter small subunit 2-like [Physeter catodon]